MISIWTRNVLNMSPKELVVNHEIMSGRCYIKIHDPECQERMLHNLFATASAGLDGGFSFTAL